MSILHKKNKLNKLRINSKTISNNINSTPESEKQEKQIETLANLLYQKAKRDKQDKIYASAKTVLSFLGIGVTLAAAFAAPKAAPALINTFWKEEEEWGKWKQFNLGYLLQTLRRLQKQKLVEIKYLNGKQRITITQKGKTRILEYAVDELEITKPKAWDKKWRVIIYDIPRRKKYLQELMREALKNLGFLAIQESVYIIPHPCYKEIEFLREYYHVGPYIKYLLVDKLEDDSAYKTYFGLQ